MMRLYTIDPKEYNNEIDRFNNSVIALQGIFSKQYASKFTEELDDKISKITVYTDRLLIGGGYYGDTNIVDGRFNIRYGKSDDIKQNMFITIHELSHVIITPINKSEVRELNGVVSSQGITKLDTKENKFYGIAFTESFCNILAKISIINRMDGNVENYINNGLHNYVYNYYEPFEDITRLLIFASKNDYSLSYKIDDYIKNYGINGLIDNKSYSLFIESLLNYDFSMEEEFDSFTSKKEFRNMCLDLDNEMLKIDINKNIDIPNYDKTVLENQLVRIETYYFNKLEYLTRKGIVDKIELRDRLWSRFEDIINSIRSKFNVL